MADITVRCVGGPLDGKAVPVRATDGFLAADKANGRAYLYRRTAPERYEVCTDHDNSLVYPDGPTTGERRLEPDRLWAAGEASAIPIIAVESGR